MSRRNDASKHVKKWKDKAKKKFGVTNKGLRSLLRRAGIKNLDSQNDIRTINRYLKEEEKPDPTPTPTPDPTPTPTPDPTPDPTPTPTPDPTPQESPYKTLYEEKKADYDRVSGDLTKARQDIGGYTTKISGYETSIGKYKQDIGRLTDLYEGAVQGTKTLTTERDDLQKRFDAQTEEFEQAKSEADTYRRAAVDQQLAGIRGGATAGGSNQTATGTGGLGSLASGQTGYSSSKQDRDKGLADYVIDQGGATDSVLNREGPVVQLMGGGNRQAARGRAQRRIRSAGTGAGTGSYYASRFGG